MNAIDIAAVVILAALAGTGVGGGGLLVIYLTMFRGTEQIEAQALNLIFFISASFAAAPFHFKIHGVDLKIVAVFSILGIIGTYLGGICRNAVSTDAVRIAFGIMLIVTGALVLFRREKHGLGNKKSASKEPRRLIR